MKRKSINDKLVWYAVISAKMINAEGEDKEYWKLVVNKMHDDLTSMFESTKGIMLFLFILNVIQFIIIVRGGL